jgi:hypothetical protein
LDRLPAKERDQILRDLARLGSRAFPGEIKRIGSLPGRPLQADAGRFRILHQWDGDMLWVLPIFAGPHQAAVFRSFRKTL